MIKYIIRKNKNNMAITPFCIHVMRNWCKNHEATKTGAALSGRPIQKSPKKIETKTDSFLTTKIE